MECRVLRLTDTIFKKRQKKCEKRVDMRKQFWYNSVLSGGCVMLRNLNANVAQSVEQLIRNQQVMCSSHTTSSKKHRKLRFSMLFVAKTLKKVWVKMWVNCLTHTVTHTRNYPDRSKEYRRGSFCLLSGIFAFSAYMTCAMKLPIFSAAFCCICLVAWV